MRKRVTFSVDGTLLKRLDQLVDGIRIRNRSHALEIVLEKLLGADVFILVSNKSEVESAQKRARWLKDSGFNPIFVAPAGIITGESITDPRQGTAAAIFVLQQRIRHTFIVVYDNCPQLDIHDMLRFHHQQGGIATMAVTSAQHPKKFGVVKMRGVQVTDFVEKPKEAESYLVSAGVFIFEPGVFNYIHSSAKSLEQDVLNKLATNQLLNGYLSEEMING